jgi:LacI family transcriptional regulator
MINKVIKILVLTDFSSGYSRSLLKGIVRYSQTVSGWTFYRMPLFYRMMHGDEEVMKWAKNWKADAIVAQLSDLDIGVLRDLNIPIIVQNYRDRIPGVCNLTGDYVSTGSMAADFFINKGYTNFAYYGVSEPVWSRERYAGFSDRLALKGFDVHTFFEFSPIKDAWAQNSDAIGAWLQSLPKPVALFACDDYYALHISETCKISDIAVPDEIAILGVDNDELICNISSPPLSSIMIDSENGGYMAGRVLHDLICRKITEPFNISVMPLQVIPRESTEKYVLKDKYIQQAVEYIEANSAKPISVSKLLELVPFSRRVFEKRFKANTGLSIYQFIQRNRIENFATGLLTSDRAIEDLAISGGFEDYKNVSRVFMRYKGVTPSQFRKQHARSDENFDKKTNKK